MVLFVLMGKEISVMLIILAILPSFMETIKNILNKIKWHEKDKDKFVITYFDRILNKELELPFKAIKRFEGEFAIFEHENEEVNLPMHRIRAVKKGSSVVWQREKS